MKNKKHIICLVMIIISVCAMSLLIYIWTIHRNDKNSEAATEYKTGAEMFGVTPTKITSIKVVVNSGTAKGNEYNLTKEEKTDIYNNIVKIFFGKDISYFPIETSYDDYSLKVSFFEQDSKIDIFIYDEDTIKVDQSDTFYKISPEINNTIFKNLIQQD